MERSQTLGAEMKFAGVIAVATLSVLTWGFLRIEPATKQPVEFPHKTHVQLLKLVCTSCHQLANQHAAAGRPPTALCLACHSGGAVKSPEVEKLRAFGKQGTEVPWQRVWRLPPHVFFPHRVHVAVAKIPCQTCHGPMESLERPPARPLKTLRMADCIGCHEKWEWTKLTNEKESEPSRVATVRRVSTDCITCHR
jgi:hypothetical protein